MTQADLIYKNLIMDIIQNGQDQVGDVRASYIDGEPAYTRYINHFSAVFKPEDGLPLLQSKKVAVTTFLKEIDWIWRQMSNNVDALKDVNCHVWDEWAKPDGTIGPAYGAQLAKKCRLVNGQPLNQVEYILNQIQHNPRSRRIMTNLYDVDDLNDMALEPCVFLTNWQVDDDDRLHLSVIQRSADCALGLPSNWWEYGVLHRRIAQVTGKKLGNLYWTIFNAHIYHRHLDLLKTQVNQDLSGLATPELILPEDLDFFKTPLTECKLRNYQHLGSFKYEVAI